MRIKVINFFSQKKESHYGVKKVRFGLWVFPSDRTSLFSNQANISENQASKMKFFGFQGFFFITFNFKNGCKNEFKDNNEKSDSWSRNRVLTKSISKPYGCATAMPSAWELTTNYQETPVKYLHRKRKFSIGISWFILNPQKRLVTVKQQKVSFL